MNHYLKGGSGWLAVLVVLFNTALWTAKWAALIVLIKVLFF